MNTRKLLVTTLCLGAALSLHAATFVVSNLGDSGPGTLRQAILDANASPGDDDIAFSVAGTIAVSNSLPAVTGGTAIIGPGTNLLTISGSKKYKLFDLTGGNTNSFSDLTLADSKVNLNGGGFTNSPTINNEGTLSMLRCVMRDCLASSGQGGGIYNLGSVTLQACVLTNCGGGQGAGTAFSHGGGIYSKDGTLNLRDCSLIACRASDNYVGGGGICGTANTSLKMTNTRIERCSNGFESNGGGIYGVGNIVLDSCILSTNSGWDGGGIFCGGNLVMTNTTIIGNSAGNGGGICGVKTGIFVGCTIQRNKCSGLSGGGGIASYGNLTFNNCTISQNFAYQSFAPMPSAILLYSAATVTLNHCTVISNSGPCEIIATNNLTSQNSIIGNITGTLNSAGYNLLVNTNGIVITGTANGDIYNVNPNLGPLQNNGGPTFTHALLPGSPALNSASDGGLSSDQRGAPHSSGADIGSFESVQVVIPNLNILLTDPTHVTLSWPTTPAPLVLQQRADLGAGNWSDINSTPLNSGGNSSITLPTDSNSKFYRLRNP